MSKDDANYRPLQEVVQGAIADRTPLRIVGGDSKAFYGRVSQATPLSTSDCQGIVNYEPTELVLTAQAGTLLRDIEAALDEQGQCLGFEPPHFGETATLGGAIACGLSGPRRAYAGAARDFVLGVRLLNGRGEILRFGGEVMKNVAGYDVSRLMTGALGTLGVLLEVSLKVLPKPAMEETRLLQLSAAEALTTANHLATKPYPLSATAYDGKYLHVRLSGAEAGVQAAARVIGGERAEDGQRFWSTVREQEHAFFQREAPLWRLSVPSAMPPLDLPGQWFTEWGGSQRWLYSEADADSIRAVAKAAGGHASLFRGGDRHSDVFQPLPPALLALHQRLKSSFDPHGIFNPGRLYQEF